MKTDILEPKIPLEVLSVEAVALMFGVEETTVREWAKNEDMPARKIGKQWFFSRRLIEEALERKRIITATRIGGAK